MDRPRHFFPLDDTFLVRDTIQTLGERHGPQGPLLMVALIAEASGAVTGGKREDFDVVKWTFSAVARRAFVASVEEARAIVQTAHEIGLVEVLEQDELRFRLRLLRWGEWHPKDPGAAGRQKRSRAARTARV